MRCARTAGLLLALALAGPAAARPAPDESLPDEVERVSREELLAAMRPETAYDATKTTNLPRFQGRVLLRLLAWARERRPDGPPLFIHHDDWFGAYLEHVGLEPEQAPLNERLSHEHGQDTWLDDRPDRVVERVVDGPMPRRAVNVLNRWPEGDDSPDSYSYDDTLSRPQLEVTVERVVRYRLLEIDDAVVIFDEIDGLRGRPTTGVLAVIFKLIGKASAEWSRMGFAGDGSLVVVGRGRKGFLAKTATVTVAPDGTAEPGVPEDRPDLAELEQRLQQPFEYEYVPRGDQP